MGHSGEFLLQEDRPEGRLMKYRNIKNENVIDIPSVLIDREWEAVSEEQPLISSDVSDKKKAVRSNGRKLRNSR